MSSGYKSKRHKGKERERDKEKERQGNQVPYSTVDDQSRPRAYDHDGPQWSQWCWSDEYKGYYRSRDGSNGELEYDWDNRTNVASSESQHRSSSQNYTTETPRAYETNDPNVYALNTAISALDVSSNTRRTDQSSGYSSAMMYAPGTNITPGRQETYQSSFYSSITESSSRQEDYPSSASFSPNIYGQGPASGPATAYVPPSPSVPAAGGSYSGPIAQVYQSPMAYETEAGVGTSYGQGGDSDPGPYTSQTYPQNYQQSSQPLPPIWLPHPINAPCECDKNKLCGVLIWPKPPNDPENGKGRIEGPDGSKAACVSESDKLATVSTMGPDGGCMPLWLPGITPSPEPRKPRDRRSREYADYERNYQRWKKGYDEWKYITCPCGWGYFNRDGIWISGGTARLPGKSNPLWEKTDGRAPPNSKRDYEKKKWDEKRLLLLVERHA